MNKLQIAGNLPKRIKQGASFLLAGTMLMTAKSYIQENSSSRDNHRYHRIYQMQTVSLDIYEGINIYVNKTSFTPLNVNGEPVIAFSYNGTTYLPIRAIAGIFGLEVKWDNQNQIVYLSGTVTNPVNNSVPKEDSKLTPNHIQAYQGISLYLNGQNVTANLKDVNQQPVKIYAYNGTTYLPVRAISQLFNVEISWDALTSRVFIGEQLKKFPVQDEELADAIDTVKTYLPLYDKYAEKLDARSERIYQPIIPIAEKRYEIISAYENQEMPLEIKQEIETLNEIINDVTGKSIKLNNLNYSNRLRDAFKMIDKIEEGQSYTESDKKYLLNLVKLSVRDYEKLDEILDSLTDEWLASQISKAEQCLRQIENYRGKTLVLK